MAKFTGTVGYIDVVETSPGISQEVATEREYRGDLLRTTQAWQNSEYLNDDFTINNRFSIVADAYAYENYSTIRFVNWKGAKWKVTGVEIKRPRIILTVKGVYNG
jgi:hypothetical protein